MNTDELPDDPREWPTDPFELLGVKPGADESDIRRAYTRLIRRFKPEHHPEQFRRIREAYEACLSRNRWFTPPPHEPGELPEPRRFQPVPTPDVNAPLEPTGEAPAEPAPAPPADEADRLWAEATGHGVAKTYAGLAELARSRPDRADVPLRLYWLLALNPDLDPERSRHHWLAEALTRSQLSGPAAELYRRELEANSAGLYDPYHLILSIPAESRIRFTIARWRLAAAGRNQAWYPADADLAILSAAGADANDAAWLGLVASALDWAVWEQPEPLYTRCRDELARLRHLELQYSHTFDRIEAAEYLAADWRAARTAGHVPEAMLRLIPRAWAGYTDASQEEVRQAVAGTADDPVNQIMRFDRLMQARGGGLLVELTRMLEWYRRQSGSGSESEFPPDLVRGLVRVLAARLRLADYGWVRTDLLQFLIAEAIDPLECASAWAQHPDYPVRVIAGHLQQDRSLRLVWLAVRLHQGSG